MSTKPKPSAILISASSDIGTALATRWITRGWKVRGTFRTTSANTETLKNAGVELVECDLASPQSTQAACQTLRARGTGWDVLVLCSGLLDPVGTFSDTQFSDWERSLRVNFSGPLQVVHELLPLRNTQFANGPLVLFFAGGGTNSAPKHYSAYTAAKIALIKMCELLHAEIPGTRFAIIGPGWVNTRIHQSTLMAGERAGENYQTTLEHIEAGNFTPMEQVLRCCDWLVSAERDVIGGRNFSVVYDKWDSRELDEALRNDPHLYKLRRRQ